MSEDAAMIGIQQRNLRGNGRAEGTSPVGGRASSLNGYQSSWTGEMERKIEICVQALMMLVISLNNM